MTDITALLGAEAESLLNHQCRGIPASMLHLPGPDYVDRVVASKDVKPGVMRASAVPLRPRAPGKYRLSFRPAGGSGRGAFRWRLICPQPDLFRS